MAYRPPNWNVPPKPPVQQKTAQTPPPTQRQGMTQTAPPAQQQRAAQTSPPAQQQRAAQTPPPTQQQRAVQIPPPVQQQGTMQPNPAPQHAKVYVSTKIVNFHYLGKAIDFNALLVPAKEEDFAMIHGCGGKDHAKNSTIGVVICDHSKGTGNKSLTLRYNIDVHDIDLLRYAALRKAEGAWKLLHPNNPMRPGPGDTPFVYCREKINPVVRNSKGYAPVSRLEIKYCPIRKDGTVSKNPWYIAISNCDAPVQTRQNGAVTYNGKAAENRKVAFVNMGYEDFVNAMSAVYHHIRKWETVCYNRQFLAGYQSFAEQWAKKE